MRIGPSEAETKKAWERLINATNPEIFRKRLFRNFTIAGQIIGLKFQKMARDNINAGIFKKNSPLTLLFKGSSKPLVDSGELFTAITFSKIDAFTIVVGVKKRRQKEGEDSKVDIAKIVHDGATIDVNQHPQVRRAVFAKMKKFQDKMRNPKAKIMSGGRPIKQYKKEFMEKHGDLANFSPKDQGGNGQGIKHMKANNISNHILSYFFDNPSAGNTGGAGIWVIPPRPFIRIVILSQEFRQFVLKVWNDAWRATWKQAEIKNENSR